MIEIKNLTKYFGTKKAVDNISFSVGKGEILGFLGPNGAGKSTTMRMVTGFIPPTSGAAVIGGHDIITDPISARKKIGYLPENAPVYPDMTVFGYLDFCADIRGFSGAERTRRIDEALEKCSLTEVKHQSVSTLSKGYKQRVCFAQSIIHDPEYLILDEPTDGLDPNQKYEVRRMIRKMSADKTIVLSTHILEEMDAVCTRAVIIAEGRIVADDTPSELRKMSSLHGAATLAVHTDEPDPFLSLVRNIDGVKNVKILEKEPGGIQVRIYPADPDTPVADKVISTMTQHHYRIKSVFVEQGRLDEVFRKLSGVQADLNL
jgi:ABC-2 type transport system ATP-binding protein